VAITDEVNQMIGFSQLFGERSRADPQSLMPMNRCNVLVCDWSVINYLEAILLPQTPGTQITCISQKILWIHVHTILKSNNSPLMKIIYKQL